MSDILHAPPIRWWSRLCDSCKRPTHANYISYLYISWKGTHL